MKKIILLIAIFCSLIGLSSNAQFACNASFTQTYLTASNVKFIPLLNIGTPNALHTWKFGDGSPDSTTVSPTHNYTSSGIYTVQHIIGLLNNTNIFCRDTVTQIVQIGTSPSCVLQANFSTSHVASSPLVSVFTNTSIGAAITDSIRWTFGDGTSANTFNATHTYANYGVYNVCLRIIKRNPNGVLVTSCASEICHADTISAPTPICNVQAAFSNVVTPGTANPLSKYFANTSTNIVATDSIRWTFGDGTSANTFNANHVYANYGTYNVCLRVIKRINGILQPNCASEYCRIDTVATPICSVQALFTNSTVTLPTNPLTKTFLNTTAGLTSTDSIRWTFGDGTSANTFNATHTYANYGVYNVCLRVIKRLNGVLQPNCASEYCRLDTIIVPNNPCNIQAYFTTNVDTAFAPGVILFTNQSQGLSGVTSYLWNFGDGTAATISNTAHTYTTPGVYTVCLTITSQSTSTPGAPPCVRQYCKIIRILQSPTVCNLAANFNIVAVASSPLVKYYNNTSLNATPIDSIRWTYGDGTSSNIYSPTHTYANAGVYHVCLRIIKRNATGSLTNCISEICKYDTIATPNLCNIQAYFAIAITGNIAQFTNQTIGILPTDVVTWTFGDGSIGTGANPVHTYATSGAYTACIRIVRQTATGTAPCVKEYCKTFTITPPITSCNILANFSWARISSTSATNLYQFTNTTTGLSSTDSIRWSFGDGTFSNAVNPTHSYAQVGPYQVCIRVQKRNAAGVLMPNCISEKCYTVVVATPTGINCANVTLAFNTITDPLYINRKTFVAFSNSPILSQAWTITRLPQTAVSGSVVINQFNPTYAFLDSGSYRVCLRAIFANNCVKEYCTTITIALPTPTTSACNLMLFPNPANTTVTGTITLSQPLILYAFIYNSQNMLVAQKTQQGAVGLNNVSVNIGNLPVGIYRYRLYYGFQTCVSTFLKQ